MSVKIILADDHDIIRQGLRHILEREPDLEIIGEARDGIEVIQLVAQSPPDVVIMDITMPESNGIEATRRLHQTYPEVKVIVFSCHSTRTFVLDMLRAGASGYMLKQSPVNELSKAVRVVLKDQAYVSPSLHGILIDEVLRIDRKKSSMQLAKPSVG